MEPNVWYLHIPDVHGHVDQTEYLFNPINQARRQLAPVSPVIQPFKALMFKGTGQPNKCIMSRDKI